MKSTYFLIPVTFKLESPFYASDSEATLSSCNEVSDALRLLKQSCDKRKVLGGLIFTCCGRGDLFFGKPCIDSSPFLENFPDVTFAGTYCTGEIARGKLSMYDKDDEGRRLCSEPSARIQCCLPSYVIYSSSTVLESGGVLFAVVLLLNQSL